VKGKDRIAVEKEVGSSPLVPHEKRTLLVAIHSLADPTAGWLGWEHLLGVSQCRAFVGA